MSYNEDHLFKEVSEVALSMSTEERIETMRLLRLELAVYESESLDCLAFRRGIYSLFDERKRTEQETARGGAMSKLSRNRNSAKTGLNQSIGETVEADIREANRLDFAGVDGASEILLDTQFNFQVLTADTQVEILQENDESSALDSLGAIRDHQNTLTRSVVMMASRAAKERKNGAPGDMLEYGDFLHEAYMVVAEACELYDPQRYPTDVEAERAFTRYIFRTLRGGLSHYEVENSRLVKVPRTRVDRWRAVGEAQGREPTATYAKLANMATLILAEKREESTGLRKIPRSEAYTEEEVFELVKLTQSNVSLHEPESLRDGESDFDVEVGDLLVSEDPFPDQQVDLDEVHGGLMKLLRRNTSGTDQLLALTIRYGLRDGEDWVSLTAASAIFETETGRALSRSKLSAFEKDFKDRVLQNPDDARELLEVFNGR